jgi:transcriptional regulator with XRE-family HTH domain
MEKVQLKAIRLQIQNDLAGFRKQVGLTQDELANRVNCSTKFISDIESGRRGMSVEMLINICTELDVRFEFINDIVKNYGEK